MLPVLNWGCYSNGTCKGSAFGHAAQFDGLDDYVVIPRSIADSFTISLWVKTSQPTSATVRGLVDGDNTTGASDYSIAIASGRVTFRVDNTTLTSPAPINNGAWHLIAVTRNSTNGALQMFIDGALTVLTASGSTGSKAGAANLHVGELRTGTGQFAGQIDELTIYGRVLSDYEIAAQDTFGGNDGRGTPFLRYGDGAGGARVDMGALESQPNPLPGDYNFNGVVDSADYTVWRDTLGATNDLRADSSGTTVGVPDGVVDSLDYDFWRSHFGNVLAGAGAGSGAAVATTAEAPFEFHAGRRIHRHRFTDRAEYLAGVAVYDNRVNAR